MNARFAKPFDSGMLAEMAREQPFVLTIEDHVLAGGFGSAALEAAQESGARIDRIHSVGLPDRFIPHGSRDIHLSDLGLSAEGIAVKAASLLGRKLDLSAVRQPAAAR